MCHATHDDMPMVLYQSHPEHVDSKQSDEAEVYVRTILWKLDPASAGARQSMEWRY